MELEELHGLLYINYGNTGTKAFYCEINDCYYNDFGQMLRDPECYDQYSEGYTPFGDE